MRLQKNAINTGNLILPFFIFAPWACNAVAGIELGKLGLCPDGSLMDGTNCEDAGPPGTGGITNSESSTSSSNGGSSSGAGVPCEGPWQRHDSIAGRCYLQEFLPRDWAAAEQRCIDLGGHLIAIDSPSELGLVAQWMNAKVWIGGTDAASEGTFVWTNGQPWSFASWKDGFPVDPTGTRDCAVLVTTTGDLPVFDCRRCTEKHGYICESVPMIP